MGWNVPDDWGMYYSKCEYCGKKYHASEGGCYCLDDHVQCHYCQNGRSLGYNAYEAGGWVHSDDAVEIDGKHFHLKCAECECCALGEGSNEADIAKLKWVEDADQLLCPDCVDEDHYCDAKGPLLDHLSQKVEAAE